MHTDAELKQIIEIFQKKCLPDAVPGITVEKRNWYSDILKDLEVFGYNNYSGYTKTPESVRAVDLRLKEVSINRFAIVTINSLFCQVLAKLYSDEACWSHPGVLKLLESIASKDFHRVMAELEKEHGSFDRSVIKGIRLFLNMTFGILNSQNSKLCLNQDFDSSKFREACDEIVNSIIQKSGHVDDVVLVETDTIIFTCRNSKLSDQLKNEIHVRMIGSDSKEEKNRRAKWELNHFCRKFKINIVP